MNQSCSAFDVRCFYIAENSGAILKGPYTDADEANREAMDLAKRSDNPSKHFVVLYCRPISMLTRTGPAQHPLDAAYNAVNEEAIDR